MNKEIQIGDCYRCRDGHDDRLEILILGQEDNIGIYHIAIMLFNFYINFIPVHKDILNSDIIELIGKNENKINKDIYSDCQETWIKQNNGCRTYFTVPLKNILEYAVEMYKYAIDNNLKHNFHQHGNIIIPMVFPTNKEMISINNE